MPYFVFKELWLSANFTDKNDKRYSYTFIKIWNALYWFSISAFIYLSLKDTLVLGIVVDENGEFLRYTSEGLYIYPISVIFLSYIMTIFFVSFAFGIVKKISNVQTEIIAKVDLNEITISENN